MLRNVKRPTSGQHTRPRLEALEDRLVLSGDMVLQWNAVLLDAVRVDRTAPPIASRAMAIVHAAVYDAVNAIDRTHEPLLVDALAHPKASREAAVAAAAHRAVVALFPAQAATFNTALTASLDTIPNGKAEDDGVALGRSVADRILVIRATDGFNRTVPYTPGTAPGDWRPTPPGFGAAVLPQWAAVAPWCMSSGDQFRPDGIPALESAVYAAAFNEVKVLGAADAEVRDRNGDGLPDRTPEQTAIALFWANGAGTATPAGHLNLAAAVVAEQFGNTLAQNARLFALLNVAMADAAIMSWDAKYEYNFWRPVTAIRAADTDGNPETEAEPTWSSRIVTPPFPAYTSGHSSFSGAAAAVLAGFFGTDAVTFTLESEDPTVGSRTFTSFSAAAAESAVSRLYGGIHWSFDNNDGLTSGTALGDYAVANFLRPANRGAAAGLVNGELIVVGSAGNDVLTVDRRGGRLVVEANGRRLGAFAAGGVQAIVLDGRDGNDALFVGLGINLDATLYGGRGNDLLSGGSGDDRLFGEDGHDLLLGNAGADLLEGGAGGDVLFGGAGADTLHGGDGDDWVFGGLGVDLLDGGSGRNRLFQ